MLIDVIVLLLIVIFFAMGVKQGFIVSLLILASWLVGVLSAYFFSGAFASVLSANISMIPPLNLFFGAILAFLFPFLLIRIAASVAKYFMSKNDKNASPLTIINRILGGIWGALKGIVIVGIILTVISLLPTKGGLKQTMEKSITYSIYKIFPFANLWEEFRVPVNIDIRI
jgi:membrane protein required for colicin V production